MPPQTSIRKPDVLHGSGLHCRGTPIQATRLRPRHLKLGDQGQLSRKRACMRNLTPKVPRRSGRMRRRAVIRRRQARSAPPAPSSFHSSSPPEAVSAIECPPNPCVSGTRARARSSGKAKALSISRSSRLICYGQRLPAMRRQCAEQVLDHGAHPADNLQVS